MPQCKEPKCACGKQFVPEFIQVPLGPECIPLQVTYHCPECQARLDAEIIAKQEAKRRQEDLEREQRRINFLNEGIPPLFANACLTDFPSIDQRLKSWIDFPSGFLFLHGVCGVGKTYLTCAIAKDFRRKGTQCGFVQVMDLFAEIRNSFSGNQNELDLIRNMANGLKIFDDFGTQKITDFVIDTWYTIVDKRYRNLVPTIFTSNLSLREISTSMGDRIASRLASGTVIELSGSDQRLKKNKPNGAK